MAAKRATARDANGALLEAGALLPPKAPSPKDQPVDTVDARSYRHPALGERAVVELCPRALAEGQDLQLAILGFEAPTVREAVGKRRQRALGFPGWALINDPDHARYALEVLRDFQRAERQIHSKPGAAKDAFDAIGAQLGRSVAHFLPSFYEEVGRSFLEAGNNSYAAQAFGKAREAEAVHGLAVDENLRRQAFLEFALAGAVTIKALTAYARELEASHAPEVAFQHFRELALRRTLGGMPPWASMGKDIGRLAKAAGLDVAAAQRELIGELIDAPALARAPGGFWKEHERALLALCEADPARRLTLARLEPAPSESTGFATRWASLCERAGVFEAILSDEAEPGLAARWIQTMAQLGYHGIDPACFAAAERLAPRLAADGVEVELTRGWRSFDIDMIDLLLKLGAPVKVTSQQRRLYIDDWTSARLAADADDPRGRDLTQVTADERFAALIEGIFASGYDDEPLHAAVRRTPALDAVREAWLRKQVEQLGHGGLPAFEGALWVLANLPASVLLDFPDLREALAPIEATQALRRSLVAGIPDELGWPALEAAYDELAAECPKDSEPRVSGRAPLLTVNHATRAIVVGPEGRLLEHAFRLPKGARLGDLHVADGQLRVQFYNDGWQAYWSGQPADVRTTERDYRWRDLAPGTALFPEGGGVCYAHRTLRAGDTHVRERPTKMVSDGRHAWVAQWRDGQVLAELDPATGELGRSSLPAFFEAGAGDGLTVDLEASWLAPLPAGRDGSPLGARDGLSGWRWVTPDEERVERGEASADDAHGERIDGARWAGRIGESAVAGLLDLPGHDAPRPLVAGYHDAVSIHAPEGFQSSHASDDYRRGTPCPLPLSFWPLLEVRDEAGSRALRQLSDDDARALLDAAAGALTPPPPGSSADAWLDGEEGSETVALPAAEAALAARCPAVAHERLRGGVLGIVRRAARAEALLRDVYVRSDPDTAASAGPALLDARQLRTAVGDLFRTGWGDGPLVQVRDLSAFFADGQPRRIEDDNTMEWPGLIGRIGGLAVRAALPGVDAEERRLTADLLEIWAGTRFADAPASFRQYQVPDRDAFPAGWDWQNEGQFNEQVIGEASDNRYFGCRVSYDEVYHVLEHAPQGAFVDLPRASQTDSPPGAGRVDAAWLRESAAVLRELETPAWDEALAPQLEAACGLDGPEAALLIAGVPGLRAYESNFLPKPLRTAMGLKVKAAEVARDRFKSMPWRDLLDVYAGAAERATPAELADLPALVGHLLPGAAAAFGAPGRSLPEGLSQAVDRDLPLLSGWRFRDTPTSELLQSIFEPAAHARWTADGSWTLDSAGNLECDQAGVFGIAELLGAACLIPYLASELPAGEPLLEGLPALLAATRERLEHRELLLPLCDIHEYSEGEHKLHPTLALLGETPLIRGGEQPDWLESRDADAIVGVQSRYRVSLAVRPARVERDEQRALIARFASPVAGELAAAARLQSDGYTALAERAAASPLPAGAFEANPLASAPELVSEVAEARGLSEPAAALYLQVLTLAAPTDKRVQRWNGWKPAQLKQAGAELVAAGLLLEAKRARAQRKRFLPGAWQAEKKILPFEPWKAPLFGLVQQEGRWVSPLGALLPLEPLHRQFAAAWARVEAGDAPDYEEVR